MGAQKKNAALQQGASQSLGLKFHNSQGKQKHKITCNMSSWTDLPIASKKVYHLSQFSPDLCQVEINNFMGKFRVPRLYRSSHKTQAWNWNARPAGSFAHPSDRQHPHTIWVGHHSHREFLALSLEGIIIFTQYFLGNTPGYPGTADYHTPLLKLFGFSMGLQTESPSGSQFLLTTLCFYNKWILIWRGTRTPASQDVSHLLNRTVALSIPCKVQQLNVRT